MIQNKTDLEIKIYPPEVQGVGQFDGGRITETKPVGFPHEGPEIKNLGPLFYWAWATAKGYGKIGLHPHQAFEIMSYALEGKIGHYDTLGNKSRVKAGGVQIMQTGSGVSHEEETVGDHTDFFQIWFDPNLQKTIHNEPTYSEHKHEDFPIESQEGVTIKTILGEGSPVNIVSEVIMKDITLEAGHRLELNLRENKTLASVIISGKGIFFDKQAETKHYVNRKDFALVHANQNGEISIEADSSLRLVAIELPTQVGYPLYRNS